MLCIGHARAIEKKTTKKKEPKKKNKIELVV